MEPVPRLDLVAKALRENLTYTYEGFLKNRLIPLEKAAVEAKGLERKIKEMMSALLGGEEQARRLEEAEKALDCLIALGKVRDSQEKLNSTVETKVKEGILFSNKAVTELKELFETTLSLLKHTEDLLLTANLAIRDYMLTRFSTLEGDIRRFASEHEERLIKGVCMPRSSTLYLFILDSFRDQSWNLRHISRQYGQ